MVRRFTLPGLVAAACLVGVTSVTQAQLRINDAKPSITVREGDRLLMEYRYAEVPFKPYVKQLLTPAGLNVLRDAPADHLHHHALMFAIAADGVDFWAETPACGKQVHRAIVHTRARSVNASATAELLAQCDWTNPTGQVILRDERTIQLHRAPDIQPTLLTWRQSLSPPAERKTAKLTGSHYFGLGMRFPESMDKVVQWVYPAKKSDAEIVRGDEQLVYAAWCAAVGTIDGKPVTIAVFDHPSNPRQARWFTMRNPFAYVSATMNLWKEPLTIETDKPLKVIYGVAAWDGTMTAEQIEKACQQWLALNKVD